MYKKSMILSIFICCIMLMPLVNISIAATEKYLGVQEDDEFIWTYTFDDDTINEYEDDTGYTIPFDQDLAGYKLIVNDIAKDEDQFNGYDYIELEIITYDTEDIDKEDAWDKTNTDSTRVYEYNKDIYLTIIILGAFIIANDVDWEEMAKDYKDLLKSSNSVKETKVELSGNGWIATFQLEDSKEIIFTVRYTAQGVLELYEMKYDGELASLCQLKGIPGYDVPLFLIIMAFSTAGIIYLFRKRN
ncbi:MAG: hypothetical protein ACTSR8_05645 [Promethearchaeota archaeon]